MTGHPKFPAFAEKTQHSVIKKHPYIDIPLFVIPFPIKKKDEKVILVILETNKICYDAAHDPMPDASACP